MPIIGIIGGEPTFDRYYWTINGSRIRYGTFLTALVSFLIIAAAVFLMIKSFESCRPSAGRRPTRSRTKRS